MPVRPFKRKILKITAYILGSLIVLLVSFHFWFIYHAEGLIEDLVEARSNGKLKVQIRKFKFNWFSNHMQLRDAVFYSADSMNIPTSYKFSVERINLSVKEILPLIFEKKIVIDSLSLINPDIQVTRLKPARSNTSSDTTKDQGASLPREMGRVYNSIQDALQVLKVTSFKIENGKFTLINKVQPDELPVTITNLFINLDNLKVDTNKLTGKQKILFSDNVSLQTHDQDIFFPDGRHRLSFSNFRINILKRMVEFDSCTIAASKADSARNSFSVFFDKLRLTNIDFDTLYQKEVIKADSVYCINPRFKLDVILQKRTGSRKPPPKLNELVQQLTGDLQLGFVVVENGSFDISTVRDGNPSSFTSDNNNFKLQGLRIQQNSPHPLTVKSFAMAIRNYENFLRDSTYAMQFDSVLLIDNSIYLANFSVKQMEDGELINSFSIPRFELKGLSWDDLVFEQKLSALRATLYHPKIDYSVTGAKGQKNKKQDIFQTLAGIGGIIQLNNLDINNGEINIRFKNGGRLQLENASMSLLSQNFVHSKQVSSLQKSVRGLKFKKGLLQIGNLTARMENVDFTGKDGQLKAGVVYMSNKEKSLTVTARNVAIDEMMIDNNSSVTEISGLQWQEADIQVTDWRTLGKGTVQAFILQNIKGRNTKLVAAAGNKKFTAFLEEISADEFAPGSGTRPYIDKPAMVGRDLSFMDDKLNLSVGRYILRDHANSELSNVSITNNTASQTASVTIPSVNFTADLNSIINGAPNAGNLNIVQPVIILKRIVSGNTETPREKKLPVFSIDKITVQQPELYLEGRGDISKIEWHGKESKSNSFELTNFKSSPAGGISADQILLSFYNFSLATGNKPFNSGKGGLNARINQFSMKSDGIGGWDWKGNITDLLAKDFLLDSFGKQKGQLEIKSARLNNLAINTSAILKLRQLAKENTSFRLLEITGRYDDAKNHFDWQNAGYDKASKTLSLDAFSFHPTPGKDEFIANSPYQTDYITLQTGPVIAKQFNIDAYISDTTLQADAISINNTIMKVFRDKRKPFQTGVVKPLPVSMLKKLPIRVDINSIDINDMDVEYAELNEKTNQTGVVTVKRMNGKISGASNYNLDNNDSLTIDAEGWLMDSARIKLYVKESYADPLAGFLLDARIGPFDGKILNPILIPLASIRLESGKMDTVFIQVTGGEYISTGEMKMLYRDLKIKFLNNTNNGKKRPVRGFASFLANTFIKNSNRSRTSTIFFKRIREKSAINYIVKIALNGASSTIGIKNNDKAFRKYKKEQKKRNL